VKPRLELHERVSSGSALFGLLQTQPNPALAELAGMCGYDFLLIDTEHGYFTEADYLHTLHALAAVNVLGMVRLPQQAAPALGRYLDIGVHAIVAPNVCTAEEAERLARAMIYPPRGTRGFSAPIQRVTRYGLDGIDAHMRNAREGAYLIVMIESATGVSNVDEIVAVPGVDGIFIGPADLSAALGCPGDFSQPAYATAIARIERAARVRGKLLGTAPHAGHSVDKLVARGHQLLLVGADMGLIREAMSTNVGNARAQLQQSQVQSISGESGREGGGDGPYGS
jgi:4-hydroxy-2-oxoheptanedioate aldolase